MIANMTVGKDVSALFADVVNCIQTDNVALWQAEMPFTCLESSCLFILRYVKCDVF